MMGGRKKKKGEGWREEVRSANKSRESGKHGIGPKWVGSIFI